MMDMGDRCIICGNEKQGIAIREDSVLRAYRAIIHGFRAITGRAELNKRKYNLVVCRDDYQKYRKLRGSYVRKEITYAGIGIVFTALMLVVSASKLLAIAYGLALILFLFLLAQISYMPALDIPAEGSAKTVAAERPQPKAAPRPHSRGPKGKKATRKRR